MPSPSATTGRGSFARAGLACSAKASGDVSPREVACVDVGGTAEDPELDVERAA
jgi:hypothetical protein